MRVGGGPDPVAASPELTGGGRIPGDGGWTEVVRAGAGKVGGDAGRGRPGSRGCVNEVTGEGPGRPAARSEERRVGKECRN